MASLSKSRMDSHLWKKSQISVIWSSDEQARLEKLLTIYAAEPNLTKYSKIANHFNNKTIRDVAFRIKWITKTVINRKENMNRDKRGSKRSFDDKPIDAISIVPNEDVSFKVPATLDVIGEVMKENDKVYNQITSNLSSVKINENFNLFIQARNNIFKIFKNMDEDIELMKNLPPIPVKINIELANMVLGRS